MYVGPLSLGHCIACHFPNYRLCGVRVTRSLVLCVCFVDRCLFFCFFFFWPLCCLFFFDTWVLITPLVSSNSSCPFVLFLLAIALSVLLRYMDSDYPFGIFKLFFCRVSVAQHLHFCIVVCRSLFCLLFLFSIVPLYCLSFTDLQVIINYFVFSNFSELC